MEIDPTTLAPLERYRLLIACVIPRPIAWIATVSGAGVANLAPFSFFGGVTAAPPTVMVSIGRRRGVRKDTAANLLETGEGVVHIPSRELAKSMVASSVEAGAEVDEIELTGLATLPGSVVGAPRLRDAAIGMEARVGDHLEIGDAPMDCFFLEVVRIHLRDDVVRDGLPDPRLVQAVGRLGGSSYCGTTGVFDIPRPS